MLRPAVRAPEHLLATTFTFNISHKAFYQFGPRGSLPLASD
jgi:hypothetical protein